MKLRLLGAAFAAVVTLNSANANTVYNINETINVVTSVVGTLTTDGSIGPLTAANIVDWNLAIATNGPTFGNLFGPSSGNNSTIFDLSGNGLVASATNLTFDFLGPASQFWIKSN